MPKTRFDWIVVTIVVALLGAAWIGVSRVSAEDINPTGRPPAPQIGHPAPEFTLTTPEGDTVSLSDFRGQAVLLNFWATWCGPCRVEMPDIESVYNQYSDEGFVVLAVNDGEPPGLVSAFVNELGLSFPILMDPSWEVQQTYQVRAFPTTYYIDREGIIQEAIFGSMTRPVIEDRVKQIMR
jgi:peroxiredoxin